MIHEPRIEDATVEQKFEGDMTDETREINVPLLRKVITWAIAEDDKAQRGEKSAWDQNNWCGTACCIAGYTALLQGWEHDQEDGIAAKKDHVIRYVDEIAEEALGVTGDQGSALFRADNDVDDLRRIFTELTGEEII